LLIVSIFGCQPESVKQDDVSSAPALTPRIEEGYFTGADGVRLFYRKVGSGSETAVYLHGGPSDMHDGGYELDALADGRTLIAFDQRSGGRSELVNDPELLTVEHYLHDLEALRKHFNLESMILIGQSWGSGLAIQYANRHPEEVTRLLILSPIPPVREPYWPERLEKTRAVLGEERVARIEELREAIRTAPEAQVQALYRERTELGFRFYLTDVSSLEKMQYKYWDASPEALRHALLAMETAYPSLGNWDFRPMLASCDKPILVVEGAETQVPLDATRAWAVSARDVRLLLVPGANHLTWLEGDVPKLFRQLNEFLSGQWPEEAVVVED
jgi:proline iminopeptidase